MSAQPLIKRVSTLPKTSLLLSDALNDILNHVVAINIKSRGSLDFIMGVNKGSETCIN